VFLISGKAEARERAILLSRSRGNSSLSRLTCGHRVASGRSLMHTAMIASRDYNKASPRRPVKRYAPPVSATFDGRTATLIGALDFQHGLPISVLIEHYNPEMHRCELGAWDRQTDRQTNGSQHCLVPRYTRGIESDMQGVCSKSVNFRRPSCGVVRTTVA